MKGEQDKLLLDDYKIFSEVSKMRFTWDEMMGILFDVGKYVVFGTVANRKGTLFSKHSQFDYFICTIDSDTFWKLENYKENVISKYKQDLYKYEGIYSSWNTIKFYNYVKEKGIR